MLSKLLLNALTRGAAQSQAAQRPGAQLSAAATASATAHVLGDVTSASCRTFSAAVPQREDVGAFKLFHV